MPDNSNLSEAKRALLARYLDKGLSKSWQENRVTPRPHGDVVPLSRQQRQVWLHCQMAPPSMPIYNETLTIHRHGSLDVTTLERTLEEMVCRHGIWRTTFDAVDGTPMQIIHPSCLGSILSSADLRNVPESERERQASRWSEEETRKPFDLQSGPLIRVLAVSFGDGEHRLYITFHQLVFDGVTAYQVVFPELVQIYEALSNEEALPPPPRLQYADYALWQEDRLKSEAVSNQLAYWKEKLAGPLPTLAWVNDRRRPVAQTYRGEVETARVPGLLLRKLKALSEREATTLFVTLVAGFSAVLRRYTDQEEIILGVLTAGRSLSELQNVAGYFVNPLPLRIDLSGNPTFRQLLKRVREAVIGALQNQEVPFTDIVESTGTPSDPSRNPLFQIAISIEPPNSFQTAGWSATQSDVPTGASKMDLYIDLEENADNMSGPIVYNPDIFEAGAIGRMIGHWSTLLEGVSEDPSLPISELPLLTESEQRQFAAWNDTSVDYPRDLRIQELFEIQSQRTPGAVALLFEAQEVTYRQLNERSNQLAHYLQKLGVGSGSAVGLCVHRSPEMVVVLLGILKAGGAYVPLDPNYPQERLAFMLEDSGAHVLVTQKELGGRFSESQVRQVCIDAEQEQIAGEKTGPPSCQTKAEDAAYVMYTSGSTGLPKGVMGTHRATVNRLSWMWREYPFQAGEICSQKTSLSFVDAVWEIFGPLLAGVPNLIIPDESMKKVDALLETLAANRVTRIVLVPSLLRAMMSASDLHSKLRNLRLWISSGEALPRDLTQSFVERMPGHTLLNLYGSTEVAADATYYEVGPSDQWSSVPIGKPIANAQAHVLDTRLRPVPVNVQGEIYIGGDAVSLGYWKRPELTSERFISDRFSQKPGARLYRTGDLGRYLPDGNIEYLGRRDHQVKVRGFRIELGEIEAALGNYSAVSQCVVVAREDESGDKRLIVYFESVPGLQFTISGIRAHLKAQLPEHMIPAAIVPMDALPLTPNGKIDRKALPDTQDLSLEPCPAFVAPRDEFEQMLAQLWSKVLRVSHVGVSDNFFELGGHSLLAMRIMVEIDKVFKKRLPLATLAQSPTIAELAEILRKENWNPSWASLVPLRAGGSKPPLFLMHAHGGNVLEYQPLANRIEPDQPVYALQARGLDGHIASGRTIEEMAADYLTEIRSLQPDGPYFLGGFCFGGLLAWEAAQQLSAIGQEVALLVLIQTMNPTYARFKPEVGLLRQWSYRGVKRLDLERDNLSNRGLSYFAERVKDVMDIVGAKASIAFDNKMNRGRQRTGDLPMPYILEALRQEHAKAYMRYSLRPYHGNVLLIRASKQLSGLMIDETSGWKEAVEGHLEVCHVQGHQQTILGEPNVEILARALTAELKATLHRRAVVEQLPAFAAEQASQFSEAR